MKISDIFAGNWLKADDLKGKAVVVTIESAEIEEVGQDKEKKLCLHFVGKDKGLIVNKTNATTIGKIHGEDTDEWIGKKIKLMPREVEFQGESVWAIRVSLQKPGAEQEEETEQEGDPY